MEAARAHHTALVSAQGRWLRPEEVDNDEDDDDGPDDIDQVPLGHD
jgi:hypothetical protein